MYGVILFGRFDTCAFSREGGTEEVDVVDRVVAGYFCYEVAEFGELSVV